MDLTNFQLFKNKYKKEEHQPDFKISAKIDDKFVEIGAGWMKTMKDGSKYISCKISPPKAPQGNTEAENERIKALREAEIEKQKANDDFDLM